MIVKKSVKVEVIEVRTNEAAGTTHVETIEKTVEIVEKVAILPDESGEVNLEGSDNFDFDDDDQSVDPNLIGEAAGNTEVDDAQEAHQPDVVEHQGTTKQEDSSLKMDDDDDEELFLEDEDDSVDPNA